MRNERLIAVLSYIDAGHPCPYRLSAFVPQIIGNGVLSEAQERYVSAAMDWFKAPDEEREEMRFNELVTAIMRKTGKRPTYVEIARVLRVAASTVYTWKRLDKIPVRYILSLSRHFRFDI